MTVSDLELVDDDVLSAMFLAETLRNRLLS
jgi:hypothetical protein